jgi:hypothetical protein
VSSSPPTFITSPSVNRLAGSHTRICSANSPQSSSTYREPCSSRPSEFLFLSFPFSLPHSLCYDARLFSSVHPPANNSLFPQSTLRPTALSQAVQQGTREAADGRARARR